MLTHTHSLSLSLCAGSLMAFAWGALIPVGIIIALFYKVVWPNGHWFYVSPDSANLLWYQRLRLTCLLVVGSQIHIVVMSVGVLTVVGGVIVILLHAEWKWLETTVRKISTLSPSVSLSLSSSLCVL